MHPPGVEGRWVARLRHVSVNQVEARDAPASISTRISFSIPRIESANLWEGQKVGGEGGHQPTEAKLERLEALPKK